MKYLLDTDVVSQYAKNRPEPRVDAWLERTDDRELYLSGFTFAELSFGIQSLAPGKKRTRLEEWLNDDLYMQFFNRIIFFDLDIVARYGSLMARAKQAGFSPGVMDTLIAATALANGMILATLNRKDFERLGVELVEF
ncbi:MAG: PIN domain-containing protein [Candidatus Acidiferrales bacterium]